MGPCAAAVPSFGRRSFLAAAAGAAAGLLAGSGGARAFDAPGGARARSLSFLNTHTG
jgi:hypothetical protein